MKVIRERAVFLAAAFAIACGESTASLDAAVGDASATDASDAATCTKGALPDLDQQIAYECAHPVIDGGSLNVWVSTSPRCGGYLVLVEQDGIDTQSVYLYDPSTRQFVEKSMGSNGKGVCVVSATGASIDCSMIAYGPTPPGFVDACPDASADAAPD